MPSNFVVIDTVMRPRSKTYTIYCVQKVDDDEGKMYIIGYRYKGEISTCLY